MRVLKEFTCNFDEIFLLKVLNFKLSRLPVF